jgi:hypothetical protein
MEGTMDDRTVFREFSSRTEAEILREMLLAQGIQAEVVSDDCGDMDPALQFGRGVQLLVPAADLARAEEAVEAALEHAASVEDAN